MHLEETLCVRIGEGREVQGEWLREGGREGGREEEGEKERAREGGREGGGDEPAREIQRRRKKISLRTDYTRVVYVRNGGATSTSIFLRRSSSASRARLIWSTRSFCSCTRARCCLVFVYWRKVFCISLFVCSRGCWGAYSARLALHICY